MARFKSDPAREQAIADRQAAWQRVTAAERECREAQDSGELVAALHQLATAREAAQAADRRVHEEYLRVKRANGDGNW